MVLHSLVFLRRRRRDIPSGEEEERGREGRGGMPIVLALEHAQQERPVVNAHEFCPLSVGVRLGVSVVFVYATRQGTNSDS